MVRGNKMRYKKPDWAVQQIMRASGLIEDICKHGVGHPNSDFLARNPRYKKQGFSIHGCDGCCSKAMKKEIKRAIK